MKRLQLFVLEALEWSFVHGFSTYQYPALPTEKKRKKVEIESDWETEAEDESQSKRKESDWETEDETEELKEVEEEPEESTQRQNDGRGGGMGKDGSGASLQLDLGKKFLFLKKINISYREKSFLHLYLKQFDKFRELLVPWERFRVFFFKRGLGNR